MECSFCFRDLNLGFYFRCAECIKPVTLCVDCFSAGVTLDDHENYHSYTIPDCLDYPIFTKDFTVKEELLLLEGIQKHGMGNWKTISDVLLPNKGTKQIEEHYQEGYMGVHGYCLPQQCICDGEVVETAQLCVEINKKNNDDCFQVPVTTGFFRGDTVLRDIGKESGPRLKDRNEIMQKIALLPGSDLPGYMPLREDFEIEYENDAELMLADMEFGAEDHPSETELKLQVIRIYNQKLAERDRRKRFVIDRGLIDVKAQQAQEKKYSKEEREIVGKLRPFARFQTKEEFEFLVEGLLKARRLRNQIELYKTYKQMGFTTLHEIKEYEQEKRYQERETKSKKVRESAPYLYDRGGNGGGLATPHSNDDDDQGGGRKRRGRQARVVDDEDKRQVKFPCTDNGMSNSEALEKMRTAPLGDLLSDVELELCVKLPMFPKYYLEAKRVLLRELSKFGDLSLQTVQRMINIEEPKAVLIHDFFVKEMKIPK